MEFFRNKNTKIVSLALLIGVLCLTVGFAAFSSVLTINSSATVKPNASTFNVDFSTVSTGVTAGSVTGTGTNGATATAATINNAGDPTISNLNASFTAPGQVVTYEFYAYNAGQYVAYLTDVVFNKAVGSTTNKVCAAGTGASASLVQAACNGISVKVEVGGLTAATTTEVSSHPLAIKSSEKVTVTITYATGSAVADGPFTVTFGDITLTYSSLDESNGGITVTPTAACTAPNGLSTGNTVTCGTESFYVLGTNHSGYTGTAIVITQNLIEPATSASGVNYKTTGNLTATMLNGKNKLNATAVDYPKQSSGAGTIKFSDSAYWQESGFYANNYIATYDLFSNSSSDYAMDYESAISSTLESYESYLSSLGVEYPASRLLSIEEYNSLSSHDWLYTPANYWLGTSDGSNIYVMGEDGVPFSAPYTASYGIRPVIAISLSSIR